MAIGHFPIANRRACMDCLEGQRKAAENLELEQENLKENVLKFALFVLCLKLEKATQTDPDYGLMTTSLQKTCSNMRICGCVQDCCKHTFLINYVLTVYVS